MHTDNITSDTELLTASDADNADSILAGLTPVTNPELEGESNGEDFSPSLDDNLELFAPKWSPPVLFGQLDTPEIPCNLLPTWVGEYAQAVSETIQTPSAMAVLYVLPVLATCLQDKFEVGPVSTGYSEPMCLWTLTSLPPASRKTAVVKELTLPLMQWEKYQAELLKPDIVKNESERRVAQKRIDELEKKAAKEDDDFERKRLVAQIDLQQRQMPQQIKAPQKWVSDVTPETLQNMLVDHNECMSVISDESGIFDVMAGMYNDGKVNMDVFLQGHAGSPVRVNRQQRSVVLEAPRVSFALSIQPALLQALGQGDKRKMRGNGALARILYAVPVSNIGTRDVRRSSSLPEAIKTRYEREIDALLNIKPPVDESGKKKFHRLTLSNDALQSWHDFAEFIEKNQGVGAKFESIQDWTGKLPGAALRIAGLCHVAEYGSEGSIISKVTIERALDLCKLLIVHAQAAFDLMGSERDIDDARYLLAEILKLKKDRVGRSELFSKGRFNRGKKERLDSAINILIDRHILSERREIKTRKPTQFYFVNPAIYDQSVLN